MVILTALVLVLVIASGSTTYHHAASIKVIHRSGKTSECGGSVIGMKWILTVASCVSNVNKESEECEVYLGGEDSIYRVLEVAKDIIIHRRYAENKKRYDIALIEVNELTFDDIVEPIQLPELDPVRGVDYSYSNQDVIVSRLLVEPINAKTLRNTECKPLVHEIVTKNDICIVNENTNTSAGYPGEAVFLNTKSGENVVIGMITANTKQDGDAPSVVMRIRPFLEWILDNTGISRVQECTFKTNY